MKRTLLAAGAAASLLLSLGGVAFAADSPVEPPSVVQLCAASNIEAVDALLAGVAESQLVGDLAPLASFTVPKGDGVVVDGSVQLTELRESLDCQPGTEDPGTDDPGTDDPGTDDPGTDNPGTDNPGTDDPGTDDPGTDDPTTPAPEPVLYENCDAVRAAGVDPLLVTQPGYRTELDADGDGIACEVVEDTGSGVDTGSGSNSGEFADSVPSGSIDTGAF